MGAQESSQAQVTSHSSACSTDGAHIANIRGATAAQIEAAWSRPNEPLPEFQGALAACCLQRQWLTHTKTLRHFRAIAADFQADPWLPKLVSDASHVDALLLQLIQKGYGLSSAEAASRQHDVLCGHNIFTTLRGLWSHAGHKKPHMAFALQILLEMERADAISAKLSEVCDRAPRCASAKQQALNLLVLHSYHLKHRLAEHTASLDTRHGALARFYECMEDYLDDHKERAFKSSFMEPARYYYHATGNQHGLDHVNVHGLNWYLALLHAALGVQTPLLPAYDDQYAFGLVDFWAGLEDECWSRFFSNPATFGADFEGIPELRRRARVKRHVRDGHFPENVHTHQAKDLGNLAVNGGTAHPIRRALALYLERFAFFFSRDFFVRRSFETLNSEVKPEHAGFRKSCETLFKLYKSEHGASEDTLIEHCYRDEYYTDLDVEKVHRFFAWLGIVRHAGMEAGACNPSSIDEVICSRDGQDMDLDAAVEASLAPEGRASGNNKEDAEMQAAMEASLESSGSGREDSELDAAIKASKRHGDDLELDAAIKASLAPEVQASGRSREDTELEAAIRASLTPEAQAGSSIRDEDADMEAAIAASLAEQQLGEAALDPQPEATASSSEQAPTGADCSDQTWATWVVMQLLERISRAAKSEDRDLREAVFEYWQFLEISNAGNPAVLQLVAKLTVEDATFGSLLHEAMRSRPPWMWDLASLFFRLCCMHREGELDVSEARGHDLRAVVDAILEPFEREVPIFQHGHVYGALLTRAVAAWLSAQQTAALATGALTELVRRVSRAVVHCYDHFGRLAWMSEQIRERVHPEYRALSGRVWGSRNADVVWHAFFAKA